MKHIKNFKDIKESQLPEIGDYVICEDESIALDEETKEFISNNIGKIINIFTKGITKGSKTIYIVKYENIPNIAKQWFGLFSACDSDDTRQMDLSEIIKFSKNKEELEEYLVAKKYNL